MRARAALSVLLLVACTHVDGRVAEERVADEPAVPPVAEVEAPPPAFELGTVDADAVGRRDITIRGLVTDADGAPLVGAAVQGHATYVFPGDRVAIGLRGGGEGTVSKTGRHDETVTTGGAHARTDGEGRFALGLPHEGRTLLCVYAEGFAVARGRLGWTNLSRSGVRFRLERVDDPGSVQLIADGAPQPAGGALFSDLSIGDVQPLTPQVPITEDGRVPTTWLERGHTYRVIALPEASNGKPRRRASWIVEWDGQPSITLRRKALNLSDVDWDAIHRRAVAERAQHPARPPPQVVR